MKLETVVITIGMATCPALYVSQYDIFSVLFIQNLILEDGKYWLSGKHVTTWQKNITKLSGDNT